MQRKRYSSHYNSEYAGFLLTFEAQRTDRIESSLHVNGEAAESFSSVDWEFERKEVVFLFRAQETPSLFAAALMQRMRGSGGTGKLKMRLSDPVFFEPEISESELRSILNITDSLSTSGDLRRLSSDDWGKLVDTIKSCRSNKARELDILIAKREQERRLIGEDRRIARLTEQRDAIGLCLDIGGLNRKEILRTAKVENAPHALSMLDLLDNQKIAERSLVEHDKRILELSLTEKFKGAHFSAAEGREVRVYVTDQTPLETVLGVDLLIYQVQYDSFILIQYKAMDMHGSGPSKWRYYVEANLNNQLAAMARVRTAIKSVSPVPPQLNSFRLNPDPFYFKFCERTRPDASDESLVRGITLGGMHLEEFLGLPEALDDNGKARIGYDNCSRYFNNTELVMLAQGGWIGCQLPGTKLIGDVLKVREQGKARMLAVIETPPINSLTRGRRF